MQVGSLIIDLRADIARLQSDMNKAERTVGGAMQRIEAQAELAMRALGGIVGVMGIRELAQAADSYTRLTAQLKLATKSADDYAAAYANVQRISRTAQADISATAMLYSRLSMALTPLGANQTQIARITETVSLALKAGGATAEEAASAMLQLSQAFGSGKLAGDEFRAMSESAPKLMTALAASLNVPVGALKDMAKEGQLTADVLGNAFKDPELLDSLRQQAAETNTISSATVVLKNNFITLLGEMDKANGASKLVANSILFVADNMAFLGDMTYGAIEVFKQFGRSLAVVFNDIKTFGQIAGMTQNIFSAILNKDKIADVLKQREEFNKAANDDLEKFLNGNFRRFRDAVQKSHEEVAKPFDDKPLKKFAGTASEEMKKLQNQYDSLTQKSRDFIIGMQYEREEGEAMSAGRKQILEITNFLIENNTKLTKGQRDNLLTIIQTTAAEDALAQAEKRRVENTVELAKTQADAYIAFRSGLDESLMSMNESISATQKQTEEAQRQIDVLNKGEKAVSDLEAARLDETASAYDQNVAWAEQNGVAKDNIDYLKQMAQKYHELADAKRLAGAKSQELDMLKKAKDAAKDLEKSLTDALLRGFESGKDFAQNFKDTLINMFKTLVLRPIISAVVNPVAGAVTGALGIPGVANAGTFSGGGIGNIFSTIKDGLSSLNTNVVGSIEKLGTFLSTGQGGLADKIGGLMGQYSSQIAGALSFMPAAFSLLKGDLKGAAFQGAGAGIGLALGGPVGGAIGSFLGGAVGSLFGGGGHKETYAQANNVVSATGNNFVSNRILKGRGGGAGGYDVGMNYAKYLGDAIGDLTKTFGGTINRAFTLGVSYSSKYKNINAFIDNGPARKGWGDVYFDLNKGMEQNAAAQAFFFAVKKGLVTLPDVLGNIIKRSEITLSNALDSVTQLQKINAINDSLKDLPPIFKAVGNAIKTIQLPQANALEARFNAINTYTGLFYTDAEKLETFTKQLTTTFTGLHVALPASREEFRKLVDGIDTTTASGLGLFDALVSLAPTMDAYYKALAAQADVTNQAAEAAKQMAAALDPNRFRTLVDFTRAQRYVDNGISLDKLPSYDVGTSFVPQDGPAMIHRGERILTAEENRNITANSGELLAEVRRLRDESQRHSVALIQASQKMAKILDKFDNQGIVLSETDNSGNRVVLDTRTVA